MAVHSIGMNWWPSTWVWAIQVRWLEISLMGIHIFLEMSLNPNYFFCELEGTFPTGSPRQQNWGPPMNNWCGLRQSSIRCGFFEASPNQFSSKSWPALTLKLTQLLFVVCLPLENGKKNHNDVSLPEGTWDFLTCCFISWVTHKNN